MIYMYNVGHMDKDEYIHEVLLITHLVLRTLMGTTGKHTPPRLSPSYR